MSDSFNPFNSIWPNGMKVDEEGYAVFYPLGTNKTNISTITWPEGNKLVSPFVYDKNDKLVGFADTKALEIDNNDTTININYSHFDADLDSIMENTLTINAPENATVNVKYGAVDKVLTEKIEKVLGKGNFKVNFDKDENKVTVAVSLDTTESQITEVESLLERVLPRNLVTDVLIDGVSTRYTKLEYLEFSGVQFSDTGYVPTTNTGLLLNWETFGGKFMHPVASIEHDSVPASRRHFYAFYLNNPNSCGYGWGLNYGPSGGLGYAPILQTSRLNWLNDRRAVAENISVPKTSTKVLAEVLPYTPTAPLVIGRGSNGADGYAGTQCSLLGRIFNIKISEFGEVVREFVPILDETGAPCWLEKFQQKLYYNIGTGDFLYPGAETEVVSAGLDDTFYAKLTEHGVRRLYHVPKGYTGTKDDYAAANGFKELVEPPMPMTGYWIPEWRETKTQLICEWVETEPPAEEEIQ